ISGDGTMQLKIANTTNMNPAPGNYASVSSSVVTIDHHTNVATLDIVNGNPTFYNRAGIGSSITLDSAGGSTTLNDSTETIMVTGPAQTAGWSGTGTKTI